MSNRNNMFLRAALALASAAVLMTPTGCSTATGGTSGSSLAPSPFQGEGWGEVPKDSAPITPGVSVNGTVTVWSWNIAAKSLQNLTPAFEAAHPGTHVDVEMNGTNIQARLLLSLVAGVGAPDVTQFQFYEAPHYIATGTLTDLTPVAQKYQSMFPQAVWRNCTMNGRIYAIPWDLGPCALYYKRGVFARYGIDPDKIRTWDDYIDAGRTILQKSGGRTKMLALGPNDLEALFEVLLQQTGGQVFDDQGRIDIDTPQARKALGIIRRLRQSGICSDVAAYSQEWLAGFADDSVASYPGAVWLGGLMKDTVGDYPGKSMNSRAIGAAGTASSPSRFGRGGEERAGVGSVWAVTRLPAVDPGGLRVADWGGSVLVIPKQSKNKAAAWAFVEYALCTEEGQLTQYRTESLFPAFMPALKSAEVGAPDPFFGGQRVGQLFATDVDKIPALNRGPNWDEAVGYLQQDLSHWAATGMTDANVLAEVAGKLSRRLDVPLAPIANPIIGQYGCHSHEWACRRRSACEASYSRFLSREGRSVNLIVLQVSLPVSSPSRFGRGAEERGGVGSGGDL